MSSYLLYFDLNKITKEKYNTFEGKLSSSLFNELLPYFNNTLHKIMSDNLNIELKVQLRKNIRNFEE